MNSQQRKQTAITVAKLYYVDGLSQAAIAKEVGMSHSNISRIIKKCVDDGVVEIIVHDSISEFPQLAAKIKVHYNMKDVIIVPNENNEDRQARVIGERVAKYLESNLKNNTLLGIGNGKTCYYTAKNITNVKNYSIDVVQLMGAVSATVRLGDYQNVVPYFASKLNGRGYLINAPLMVRSREMKFELLKNPILGNVFELMGQTKIALFELSMPVLYARDPATLKGLTKADLLQLSEVKAASCVCGYYFDINGRSCNVGINDRIMAISQHDLKRIETSVGIITGKNSLNPAISAMKSKMINVIVMDEVLAQEINARILEGGEPG